MAQPVGQTPNGPFLEDNVNHAFLKSWAHNYARYIVKRAAIIVAEDPNKPKKARLDTTLDNEEYEKFRVSLFIALWNHYKIKVK